MGLLKPAVNQTAYLKIGMLGFAGSGKTFTAVEIAMGLCREIGKKKIAFYDTEKGSDFHIKRVAENGLELSVVRSRAFTDLLTTIREAEKDDYGCLVIDSISHCWKELVDSYLKSKNRRFISMPDWNVLKGQWSEFSDLYVNSRLHIVMCGRAAHEYDEFENDDTGKLESKKVGVKMRAETETGYEPDLLILMERTTEARESKGKRKGSAWIHRATVLKDRTDLMNGDAFNNPTYETFRPVVKFLNLGGQHQGTDLGRTSADLFKDPDRSYEKRKINRQIALETLDEALVLAGLAGTSAKAKEDRTALLVKLFGKSSKTHIEEEVPTEDILAAVETIRAQAVLNTAREINAENRKKAEKPSAEDERVAELVDKETSK